MAEAIFGCHDAGTERATTCAGFILRGADHNLAFRRQQIAGHAPEVTDGGNELFGSYREMAIANGVDKDDPCLVKCR